MNPTLNALIPHRLHPRTLLRRHLENATREGVILAGPFVGIHYVDESVGSMWWPKILGTYEMELADIVSDFYRSDPERIVDIGAAEGYYAVGMARSCPAAQVISFEVEPQGRRLQAEFAALNYVSKRLRIEGYCDHDKLRTALSGARGGVIICDIEGGELTLLDPAIVSELTSGRWTLLVELHDHIYPGIAEVLTSRFGRTHSVTEIKSRQRLANDLPACARVIGLSRWFPPYLDERRPGPMRWLLFRPIR